MKRLFNSIKIISLLAGIFPLLAGISPLKCQEVSFQAKKPSEKIYLATPFTLEMTASFKGNYSISLSTSSVSENFEILNIEKTPNGEKTSIKITAVPFALDKVDFPELEWTLRSSDNSELILSKSPSIPLEILPVSNAKSKDIKDIRPIYKPFNIFKWITILLVIFLLAGLVYFYLTRKKSYAPGEFLEHELSMEQKFLKKISDLLSSDLWKEGECKKFYSALSDIMREYLTLRFEFDAQTLTSYELNKKIKGIDISKESAHKIKSFLSSSDMVKFAKHIPDEKEMQADVEKIRTMIKNSAPVRKAIDMEGNI
jgi:hypothetical protein